MPSMHCLLWWVTKTPHTHTHIHTKRHDKYSFVLCCKITDHIKIQYPFVVYYTTAQDIICVIDSMMSVFGQMQYVKSQI